MGAVYHLGFFRRINPAATAFGALFIAQGAMMLWHGVRGRLTVGAHGARAAIPGALLVAYALVAYPAIGYALGHRYPMSPTFGLPCPTTIFTLGVLLWMRPPVPRVLFVIPVLWALVGTAAAMTLGVPEDIGLSVAAAIVVAVEIARSRPRSELRQRTHPA